ncbi:MAG: hypothetical protein JXX28_05310 [Deltaproteobacteria bacterium]|nr:hypothetical protein [Deltaproteobacteria bacterium]
MTRAAIFLPLLISACSAEKPVELDETAIFVARIGATLPMDWSIVSGSITSLDNPCPTVEALDQGLRLSGGCTDDSGTAWSGTAEVMESGLTTYAGFGTTAAAMSVLLDGAVQVDGDNGLSANLVASWDPGTGVPVVYTYSDYGVTSLADYFLLALGEEGATDLSGSMDVSGQATYTASGHLSNGEACPDEIDDGTLVLAGAPDGDITYRWSSADCDGCIAWTYGAQSGSICP